MNDPRLQHKVQETRQIAARLGLELVHSPMLATFELPIWGAEVAAHEIGELARRPGLAVAAVTHDSLPAARSALASSPRIHVVAERGLVCGLSGGATVHVYPTSEEEMAAFAIALFAGAAPANLRVSLSCFLSSGRQEAVLEGKDRGPVCSPRELLNAVEKRRGVASIAEEACVVEDTPQTLSALRAALSCDFPGCFFRTSRLPSGRFRLSPDPLPRAVKRGSLHVLAREIALSCDRFVEARGTTTFCFATEPVARGEYGPERGARALGQELFGAPDTVITHLGVHPFEGPGCLFFAYEGSEAVWEAVNRDLPYVTVRDILEYARVLQQVRAGS